MPKNEQLQVQPWSEMTSGLHSFFLANHDLTTRPYQGGPIGVKLPPFRDAERFLIWETSKQRRDGWLS